MKVRIVLRRSSQESTLGESATREKHKFRRCLIAILLISCVGVIVYRFWQPAETKGSVDESQLVAARRGSMLRSVVATGTIEPISNRVELKSKASGIVKRIHADVGDFVRKGELLVELDRDQLLAQLREARATLVAAHADLKASEAELERNGILAEGHDVDAALKDVERQRALAEQGLTARSALDEAEGRFEEAENRQRAAAALLGVTRAAIEQKRAQITQVQATIERIEEELKFTNIASPISGVVLARGSAQVGSGSLEVGSAVSSIVTMGQGATVVMTLGDMREVYVKGRVSESEIGLVRVGQPARIRLEALRDRIFEGQVYMIAPIGMERDSLTTFEVRVSVRNPEGLLLANMSANAEIVLEEHPDTVIIPEGALIYDRDQNASVEVPDSTAPEGKRTVPIELGICDGAECEVLSGVDEGDQVLLQM